MSELKPPRDQSLPFFSYGLLKPGEFAHLQIEDLVETATQDEVSGSLYTRDGLPLLVLARNCGPVVGFRIVSRQRKSDT